MTIQEIHIRDGIVTGSSESGANVDETVVRTLTPSKLVTYLDDTSDFTTPSLTANTPTKILIPTTVKSKNDFELIDLGGSNFAWHYTGTEDTVFAVNMHTGMTTSANNVIVSFFTYKNGVKEQGLSANRKVGTGSDVGALGVTGEVALSTNDYIELYVETDGATTMTFIETSINICERN